jgi:hypothetical protein
MKLLLLSTLFAMAIAAPVANPQFGGGPPGWKRDAEADPQFGGGPPGWKREAEADPQLGAGFLHS